MALNIDLVSEAGVILELDASPYGINNGGGLGMPELASQFLTQWQRGFRPLVSQNIGNRQAEFTIQIRGTSHDDWANNYRQFAQVLQLAAEWHITGGRTGAAAYLSIQLTNATATTVYEVIEADVPPVSLFMPSMANLTAPYSLTVPVRLALKPWGRPQALTRATATVRTWGGNNVAGATNPNSHVLTVTPASGMTRESPALLTVKHGTFSATGVAAGNYTQLYVGRKSRGQVENFHPFLQAEMGSATGYKVTSGAIANINIETTADTNAQGGSKITLRYQTAGAALASGVVCTVEIEKQLDVYRGRYRLYTFVGTSATRLTAIRASYGGVSGDDIYNTSMTPVAGVWNDLGIVEFPAGGNGMRNQQGSYKFQLHARMTSGGTTNTRAEIDAFCLLPIDEQAFLASGANLTASAYAELSGLDPNVTLDLMESSNNAVSVTGWVPSALPGYGLMQPPRKTKWVVLSGAANISSAEYEVRLDYWPYTEFLR